MYNCWLNMVFGFLDDWAHRDTTAIWIIGTAELDIFAMAGSPRSSCRSVFCEVWSFLFTFRLFHIVA